MKDLFDFRLEILKQEVDHLQNNIRNYNNILYVIKGWSITLFSGLVALAVQQDRSAILIAALLTIPMFWMIETFARQLQKVFIARYHKVEWFLRSHTKLKAAWEKGAFPDLNFPDMIARYSVEDMDVKTSFFYHAKNRHTSSLYIMELFLLAALSGLFVIA